MTVCFHLQCPVCVLLVPNCGVMLASVAPQPGHHKSWTGSAWSYIASHMQDSQLRAAAQLLQDALNAPTVEQEEALW